jgi:hypothetical protein
MNKDNSQSHDDSRCGCGLELDPWALGPPTRRAFLRATAALLAAGPAILEAAEIHGPCGPPKPPPPAQASGAEGMEPLPLPAVPQRRTEKKRPPRPPTIIAKIKSGDLGDWATDPNDINNLLIWLKANLGINFSYEEKSLGQIDLQAGDVPVLYRTGHNAFSFSDAERQALRGYLLTGGMMILDACCGRPAFADSARREIAAILPEHKLRPIDLDHALFNCYYPEAGLVRFTDWSLKQDPSLPTRGVSGIEGIEAGCRLLVVFSPHDMSCGWDMHTHHLDGCTYVESEDALKIGANLVAYATATHGVNVSLAAAKDFKDADPTATDKFRVGQLVHEGDWNPDPLGLQNLLDTVGHETALKVSFATEPVQPDFDQLSKYPFVYMTGHNAFEWTDAQVAAVRRYLLNGGFILADACCGRQAFDQAFRKQMAKVLKSDANPAGLLKRVPINHPLYSVQHKITTVRFTQAARYRLKDDDDQRPRLESAALGGRMAVLYSPQALNVGWRVKQVPYAVAYEPASALQLGVNAVMYVMSQ